MKEIIRLRLLCLALCTGFGLFPARGTATQQQFPLEDWQGKKIISVTLAGETEARNFILDTGSERNYLYTPVHETYRTVSIQHMVTDGTHQKEYATAKAKIDIQLLGQALKKAEFIYVPSADPLYERFQCAGISGIIGGSVIREFDWYLTDHTVQISPRLPSELKAQFSSVPLELWKRKRIPVLTAGFTDDFHSTMMFDLGDNTLVAITEGNLQYIDLQGALHGQGGGYTTSVSDVQTAQMQMHQSMHPFQIGGVELGAVLINESQDISVIGSYFLKYFDVILDYQHKTFYYRRNDQPYAGYYTHGVSIGYHQGQPYLSAVWEVPNAPWANAAVGDQVLSINGTVVTTYEDPCALRQAIEAAWQKPEVTLTLKKPNGAEYSMVLAGQHHLPTP